MANLDRIVNVQISLNTTGISKEGFSTLLIVGEHLNTLSRVTTYTNVDSMLEDGFKATDKLYLAAADAFSQIPRPNIVKIGRRQVDEINISVSDVKDNTKYKITLETKKGKQDYDYSSSSEASATTIIEGLQTLMNAHEEITVTAESEKLKLETKEKGTAFTVSLSSNLSCEPILATETLSETMAAIVASDNDFYGIALVSREKSDILALAQWTETHTKLFGCVVNEKEATDSEIDTDIGSLLKSNNYYRTFWLYHTNDDDFPECALFARCFAINPGGETWANKKLAGVIADNLTETEYLAITNKNGNTFENFRNVAITQNGKTSAGEWIDVIRFRDWLQEEIMVNVFNVLINRDKIPFTDGGIGIIEAQINSALKLGQQRGGITPDEYDEDGNINKGYVINVPLASNISANTKAQRLLEDVTFTARLAGAIHAINISGSLTYENLIEKTNQ
jgi:hypothetical protein